ncbi:LuxR family transcriptional regulator [Mycolicibacterium smegmatis]|uniref:ATP-dependent transcriptional regulator, MalT-like, LuxR family n=3 Tax=Mycolicibacterium smegmatis TaxID=1772 RepID=I7G559_MYCS2|nr:transcriptional regulator [Mycolicibacterium smegmatis MC2 155]AIU16135.1 LuxR family transcriptional regulator [Mycolicibacterium smegmatis]AFP40777.1 ATP-dependent transcriptional regulator, MalT-like, LuxR family [Mycolicibacterium smegmatis MC2 155]AIU09510.1 LuxR family transcriptional regulator [Mycolicibacterium smegmatis MC2 155]AIU22758.1 LuxR family transcriptional regulator [Mycolicibacterium smegmatis]
MDASEGPAAGHGDTERAVLLATKLHIPAIAGQLVHRTALLDALSQSCRSRLILLSAPVGWGKTTLLSQWALGAGKDQRFGWLSLDASDNDPVWFWMYVIAALQKISPGVGTRAVELLTMGADPIQVVLPTLLNDLDAVARPIVLILDDYHMVVNRAIHEQVAFAVGRMPANLHVVLATRSDPLLPLARLRANGELVEMRSDDLRFGVGEAGQLLNDVLGLDLTEEDVRLLHRRTEGWAAGLYLAALSLAGRAQAAAFIRTFAGDNRHIVDYLMAEVLDRQSPRIRNFLLRTSVMRRFNGALCDAVLQSSDSVSVLEEMERENLFLVPLDMSRHWYRYHHLFGELLRAELHRCEPELVPGLHRRAAKWFEAEGLVDEALRHLVAAGDIAESADLIVEDWANELAGGGLSTVSGWLDLLPEGTVRGDPRLSAIRAWVALNVGLFDDARIWIEAVAAGLEGVSAAEGSARAGLSEQLVALREVYAFKIGDVTNALDAARQAATLEVGEAPPARSAAHVTYGAALYFSGDIDEARTELQRAVELTERTGDRRHRVYALGYLALIEAESGQLADAEHLIRRATGVGPDPAGTQNFIDVAVSLAVSVVLYASGEWAAAADAAHLAVGLARKGAGILEVAKALMVRAKILNDFGDLEAAEKSRSEAGALLRRCPDNVAVHPMIGSAGQGRRVAVAAYNDEHIAEDLTSKELEVLRLLATRLSRRDIGQRLYVSLNTVKTHQRAIYRKLGVDNRNSAVARGRELGLL